MNDFFERLASEAATGSRSVLGIICDVKGSSPQKRGAKALFREDGTILGTLGGGCLEAEVQERARAALLTGKAETFDLVLDHDFGWDDGLICGGSVRGLILPLALRQGAEIWPRLAARSEAVTWGVRDDFSISLSPSPDDEKSRGWLYRETVRPPEALWIAGAGHIAQAVAPLAAKLDFAVTVFDDRPALASRRFFAEPAQVRSGAWEELLATELPATPTFGLIVTRGHRHDALVLRSWIQRPFAWLGMIGSQRKARIIKDHFTAENIACAAKIADVHCPVGVDIGARSVEEIAVSIAAQLIQQRTRP